MMFDLFYRLLPMNLDSHPFYLNTFLPVFTSTGYGTQNIFLPLKNYVELEEAIIKHVQKHGLTMRGETDYNYDECAALSAEGFGR